MVKNHLSVLQAFHGDCTWPGVFRFDEDGVEEQVSSALDARGAEKPDPVPKAPPVGYSQGPSLTDFVHRMIKGELSRMAHAEGAETEEEANDFDVEDDFDPKSPWEEEFWPAPSSPSNAAKSPPGAPEGAGGGVSADAKEREGQAKPADVGKAG